MWIIRDSTTLLVIHVLLAVLLVVAVLKDLFSPLAGVVTRGAVSKGILFTVYRVAISLCGLILQAPGAARGYSLGLALADTVVLTYLCFFNSWFSNKLIGLYTRIHTK